MAITQAMLDGAVTAWAQGVLSVEYPGAARITYRSRQDLESSIARMAAALGVANPLAAAATAAPRYSFAGHSSR